MTSDQDFQTGFKAFSALLTAAALLASLEAEKEKGERKIERMKDAILSGDGEKFNKVLGNLQEQARNLAEKSQSIVDLLGQIGG